MGKQLNFEYKGKQYCLEYTRATVQNMESMGFNANDVGSKMMTRLPQLFNGAFLAHHPDMKSSTLKAIYNSMPDKIGLFKCLRDMYNDPYEQLLAEPEKGEKGNVIAWTTNWNREDEDE